MRMRLRGVWLMIGLAAGLPAWAAVELQGTRVIFAEAEQRASLLVRNPTEAPVLVQTWVDAGQADAAPEQVKTPFVATPPLFRLAPGKGQGLLIHRADDSALPTDRESLYYLNVLDIPPSTQDETMEFQLTTRARLKLFYRPEGLPGSSAQAPARLHWRWTGSAAAPRLQVDNPTAFHVSVTRITVGERPWIEQADLVIAPYSSRELPAGSEAVDRAVSLQFTWMDDYGTPRDSEARIGAAPAP